MEMKKLQDKKRLILGLGQSGLSVARFLDKVGQAFHVMDTRDEAPGLEELNEFAQDAYLLWNPELFTEYEELVVSPGIAISNSDIQTAISKGVSVVGDIELFAQVNNAKVIAITGSNGKSTVTDLTTQMILAAGKSAIAAGNFGVPALSVLDQDYEYVVLELSSFQLETTFSLKPNVATILNVSEDHLDRYDSYEEYIKAKLRIYKNAEVTLANADDENTWLLDDRQVRFGLNDLEGNSWSLDTDSFEIYQGRNAVINLSDLKVQGIHNGLNVAASLALLDACEITIDDQVTNSAKSYTGLPHRCELVDKIDGVTFINDSKATNVGATVAALNSFAPLFENIVLIAGGDAKGANLSELQSTLQMDTKAVVTFGKDAKEIAMLSPSNSYLVENMAQALVKAKQIINKENLQKALVLLSPACASLDMYNNYQERGNEFSKLARALVC